MDLWRWAPVPSELPISAVSSTDVTVLRDRQQLAVTVNFQSVWGAVNHTQLTEQFDSAWTA